MSEVEAILSLIEKVSQLSGAAIAIGILVLFYRGDVVWGWQYRNEKSRADTYEVIIREHNSKTEAKLAELESRYNGKAA